ncbi:xanthine dehydrogenase/oxidase-like [Haliotis rufescens]|uniref:xanthine dehydrogenase/oxidase-like n=1 Tax=Haliotis rufescens TaxID=6454 RepID=UPI00201EC79A|nr:xanthine dehydrogenase/oxidase-like [Haliotis rufescens]
MAETDSLVFFVNGIKIEERQPDPGLSLLQYLRHKLRLTGSKGGCAEGGCGACTVMVSEYDHKAQKIRHFSVFACILPVCYLHGLAVTTVEGIGSTKTRLHPVQKRLAEAHGSQCGFCTPGMVMSMYALLRNNPQPTEDQIRRFLDGNLCRCTGYRPILDGFRTFAKPKDVSSMTYYSPYDPTQEPIFPPELKNKWTFYQEKSVVFKCGNCTWYRPSTLAEVLDLKCRHPEAKIVLGNTEISVETHCKGRTYHVLIEATSVPELRQISRSPSGITFGSAVTITNVIDTLQTVVSDTPEYETRVFRGFLDVLRWFGNTQSIGGNIIASSPLSDLLPMLMAAGATISVAKKGSAIRHFTIDSSFHVKYRSTCLDSDDVLMSVTIPASNKNEFFHGYKQAGRKEGCVATCNAGMRVVFEDNSNIVKDIYLAYGCMAPTTILATNTRNALIGSRWQGDLVTKATSLLAEELQLEPGVPGGMCEYRQSLTTSFFFKFYLSVQRALCHQNGTASEIPRHFRSALSDIDYPLPSPSHVYDDVSSGQPPDDIGRTCVIQRATGETMYLDDIAASEGETFHVGNMASIQGEILHAGEMASSEGEIHYVGEMASSEGGILHVGEMSSSKGEIRHVSYMTSSEGEIVHVGEMASSEGGDLTSSKGDILHVREMASGEGEILHVGEMASGEGEILHVGEMASGEGEILHVGEMASGEGEILHVGEMASGEGEILQVGEMASGEGEILHVGEMASGEVEILHVGEMASGEGEILHVGEMASGEGEILHVGEMASGEGEILHVGEMASGEGEILRVREMASGEGEILHVGEMASGEGEILHVGEMASGEGEILHVREMASGEGELFMALVLSERPHACLVSVDATEALTLSGVVDFITHKDIPGETTWGQPGSQEEVFASDVVLWRGQTVGAIVAESTRSAEHAASMVKIVYEDLPYILTIKEAIKNVSFHGEPQTLTSGDSESAFNTCDHVLEGEARTGAQEHFYLETMGSLVIPGVEDGKIEVYTGTQSASYSQESICKVLGVTSNKVVVKVKSSGEPLYGKQTRNLLTTLPAAVAAHGLGRPVRCVLDRHVDTTITGNRFPTWAHYKVGFNSDGNIIAYSVNIYVNAGMSVDQSREVVHQMMMHVDASYSIPNLTFRGHSCKTNLPSNTPLQGFGVPQVTLVTEQMIQLVADTLQKKPEQEVSVTVKIDADGSVVISPVGGTPGHSDNTQMVQIVSDELNVPTSFVRIDESSETGNPSLNADATNEDIWGLAVLDACQILYGRLLPFIGVSSDETWEDVVLAAVNERVDLMASGVYRAPGLHCDAASDNDSDRNYVVCGASCSEVEVDCLSGELRVTRTDLVIDAGRSANKAVDIGQIEGAFMLGYGLYVLEDYQLTPSGMLLTQGPGTYKIPSIGNIPTQMNVHLLKDVDNDRTMDESKGVTDMSVVLSLSAFFAIADAVKSARADAGCTDRFQLDCPATPEAVRMACQDQFTQKIHHSSDDAYTPTTIDLS